MTSLVFPGQGSQYQGMGRDFYDNFESARRIFEIVEDTTKLNIKKIVFDNTENYLNITKYTQISIFTVSMSIFSVLSEIIKNANKVNFVLGHSLGEYSALTASNSISLSECADLLKIRGELMQDAYEENKSGMLAVIGLSCDKIENLIKKNSMNIEVANDNAPNQVVLSGIINDLKNSEKILLSHGAKKVVYLNVSAAFHSKIMKNAEKKMNDSLKKVDFKDPLYSIISNFSGESSNDKRIIFENLSNQMSNKVKWVDSIRLLELKKEKNIIEIGPGKVLTGIIKRISNGFNLFNLNEIIDIDKIQNEL